MLKMCKLQDMVCLGEKVAQGPCSSPCHNDGNDYHGDNDNDNCGVYIDASGGPLDLDEPNTFLGALPEARVHPTVDAKSIGSGGLVGGIRRSKSAALLSSPH